MCKSLKGKQLKKIMMSHSSFGFRFEDVKSTVEFYRKYRSNPWELNKDYPKLVIKWIEGSFNKPFNELIDNEIIDLDYYFYEHTQGEDGDLFNKWLFDYCFGDVIE